MDTISKYNHLKNYLKEIGNLCIAFSGGVDSTFLLAVAHEVLGDNAMAVTVRSSMYTQREYEEAVKFAARLRVKHIIIDADEYGIKEFVDNTEDRCYYCKYAIFSKIIDTARKEGISNVADGSNASDVHDFRPGMRAIKELRVLSPLKEQRLTKDEIRVLSHQMDLPTWNKPSFACLASRIPYGIPITPDKLKMVEMCEDYLFSLGFQQFRVRYHGSLAKIEVLPKEQNRFFDKMLCEKVVKKFKEAGFQYITLDLEGYRTGSMNEVLNRS